MKAFSGNSPSPGNRRPSRASATMPASVGSLRGASHSCTEPNALAKHDENYMPPEVADATNGMHFKPEYTEAQLQGAKQ